MGCCISPNNIIERDKTKVFTKGIDIESIQNKELSNIIICKKENNLIKENNSIEIMKNSSNEYEISLNEFNESQMSSKIINNNNVLNKNKNIDKLETVKEVISEISFRKNESRNNSIYHKSNSKLSSNTEKNNTEKCEDNYNKKTNQMIKLMKK